jgi:cytochrome c peroxidase
MKKKLTIVLLLVAACVQFAWKAGNTEPNPAATPLRKWLLQEIVQLKNELQTLSLATETNQQKVIYTNARLHYKHIEFFVEQYSPKQAKLYINGPLVPKHEIDLGRKMLPQQGFQRIEEILFDSGDTTELKKESELLLEQITELENYYTDVAITDGGILEMCQMQLFRIAAMNLNGYDATISQTNITETLWTLEGIEQALAGFDYYAKQTAANSSTYKQLMKTISLGKKMLQQNTAYDSFNRLAFITKFINPANTILVQWHNQLGLPWKKQKRALNLDTGFLFGKESFNLQYFSMYFDDTLHLKEQAALGKLLFSDPILSGNSQLTCSNCHNPAKAFTDGLPKSNGIDGTPLQRNAPTLYNVVLQQAFFYDGRAYQLEQQAFDVIHNPLEMNSSLAEAVTRLQQEDNYKTLFARAFAGTPDATITEYAIQKVLAEYQKTLISFNSRFDQYLRGNMSALNKREINGYNLFAGKALCGSCHFLPLFNGTVPPHFFDSEYEVLGTPEKPDNKNVDPDPGRYSVTGLAEHRYAFKTPTLRNIALTAPYMHNGVYNTLEEVVEFYHRGGGNGFSFNIPNQTLPFDSLQLTNKEKEDIVLFMKSLTDVSLINNQKK